MFKSYLKIAFRNLLKQKGFTFINVFGLAFGFTACFLIAIYIQQELSFDKFNLKADRIYRVVVNKNDSKVSTVNSETPWPVAPALKAEYPEIESVTRVAFPGKSLLACGDKKFFEEDIAFVDSSFFDVFTFPLISGNSKEVLNAPYKILFTQSAAQKYFGSDDPVGKQVTLDGKYTFNITGIVKDPPVNSHFHFKFLASYNSMNREMLGFDPSNQWGAYFGSYTYVLLKDKANIDLLFSKTKNWFNEKANTHNDEFNRIAFQPLKDIHLRSNNFDEIEPANSVENLVIIGLIGLFILLIAAINFINLTTARATRRSKEVGIRKTVGAYRIQLIQQFLSETLLLSLISYAISLVLVEIAAPFFSSLLGTEIRNGLFTNPVLLAASIFILLMIGSLAGFYPAFVLSGFKPASAIRGTIFAGRLSGNTLRSFLVIAQFSIAIILIISTVVINKQIMFFRDSALGFKKEHLLEIEVNDSRVQKNIGNFKNDLASVPGVISYTACMKPPISKNNFISRVYPDGFDKGNGIMTGFNFVDTAYFNHFGLKLIAGRTLSPDSAVDKKAAIINETLMSKLGFAHPDEIIGRKYFCGFNDMELEIVGVVKDYHNTSLQRPITPMIIMKINWRMFLQNVSVKINSHDVANTIDRLKNLWSKYSTDYPFTYDFLDESLNNFYKKEDRQASIVDTFSIIAIFIACLGLLGLASHTTELRTKEIGIRKVLGASTGGIVFILTKDFLKLVIISGLIASPVAYYFMNKWLNDFAYKINITFEIFVISSLIAVAIALVTISYQAIRSAMNNPVSSLKYE